MTVRSTVVVVTWQGREHLTACLDALGAQARPHRVLVVDNASVDGTADILRAHPSRPEVLRLPRNAGYAGGIAAALGRISTPLIAWLNDDAAPEPEWLATLEDALADGASAATSTLLTPDGSVQSHGVRLTADGYGADAASPHSELFGFCGGAVLLRTDRLRAIGGVPAAFFCYYEDTDTAWRLRLVGDRIVPVPQARVTHLHGVTSRLGTPRFHRWNERNRLLMLLRCAPATVAIREIGRFAAITVALPIRRMFGRNVGDAPNFRIAVRLRVLAEVALLLPWALRTRRSIGRLAKVSRDAVWRQWAGR